MNKEQIEKYEQLVCKKEDLKAKLNWFVSWEKSLFEDEPTEDERFYISITRWKNGRVVLQRDTTREVAEMEFHAEKRRMEKELERINQEIEEL